MNLARARSVSGTWVILAALLAVAAADLLHVASVHRDYEGWARSWGQARVVRLEEQQKMLSDELQGAARSVAAAAETEAALAAPGDVPARSRLFVVLEEHAGFHERPWPEPLALAVHGADLKAFAWFGRIGPLSALLSHAPEEPQMLIDDGPVSTTLVALAPIRAADGRLLGVATAQRAVATRRHIHNQFLTDFDLVSEDDDAVHLSYRDVRDSEDDALAALPPAEPGTLDLRGLLRSTDGTALAAYGVVPPPLEEATARLHHRYALVAGLLGLLLVIAFLRAAHARGRLSLGTLAAAVVVVRLAALATPRPPWLESPFASPADLFYSAAAAFVVAAWMASRALQRRRALLPAAAAVLADVLAVPIVAGTFLVIGSIVFTSPVELDRPRVVPRTLTELWLQLALLLILLAGSLCVFSTQTWLAAWPRSRAGRAARTAGWIVVGLLAYSLWPHPTTPGLPLLPSVALFAVPASLAASSERWRGAFLGASPWLRAGLLGAAVVSSQVVLQPSLIDYGDKARRQQIEQEYKPLVLHQSDWQERLLTQSRDAIDTLHVLEELPPGSDLEDLSDLAFAVWSETPLAAQGLSSAVEIQDARGTVVSRFALNLPSFPTGALALPSTETWKVESDRLRLVSAETRVRHAQRRLEYEGRTHGAIHLYVAEDFWNLGFLEGGDPYPTLFRSSSPDRVYRRPAHLVVYDANRDVTFSSAERAPGLDPRLVRRLSERPAGFWTTVAFGSTPRQEFVFGDGRRTFGLSFARTGAAGILGNLVEGASGTALATLLVLVLVLGLRSALGSPTFSLGALAQAVSGRFSLRLFVAFVLLAVVPVAVLQAAMRGFLTERLRVASERGALSRAAVAQKAVQDFAYFQRGEEPGRQPVTDAALVWVASLIRNDLDLFQGAVLTASSKRELYASGLLGPRVSGPLYRALVLDGEPSAIRTERIGGFAYLVVSMPVRLDRPEPAILSIPLALRQRDIQAVVDDLDRTVRLASLIFLIGAALLAHRMARRISGPIRDLTAATERVAAGDLEARVTTASRDELQLLVLSFNRMAADLERQRGELERSNRLAAWAEMARQVAHEIKNPLTPIQLSAQHLRRVFEDKSVDFPKALQACTATILEQVQKLRGIATEFSSYARPPIGDRVETTLGALVNAAADPYRAGLPEGVTLAVDVREDVPVAVDRRLLDRAIVNLLENALAAIGEGGTVTVRTRRRADGAGEVEVEDSGTGIDPAIRGRVFEPFFSTKTAGSGLGLALVKKIVEDHGGGVGLDSEPGRGTRIAIWLPASTRSLPPSA